MAIPLRRKSFNLNNMEEKDIAKLAELITAKVTDALAYTKKPVLTTSEVAAYLGFKKSYVYKLMAEGSLPYYKSYGRSAFFKREEVEAWAFSKRVDTVKDLEEKARRYQPRRVTTTRVNR